MIIADLSTVRVDEPFHVDANGTGALIQDGKLRLVVEKSGHLKKKRKKACEKTQIDRDIA